MNVQAVIDAVKAEYERAQQAYQDRRARIMAAAASCNGDVEPTVDRSGRLHAPHDGYSWEDNTYGAGEFLPIPEMDQDDCEYRDIIYRPRAAGADMQERYNNKAKIKTTVDAVTQIKDAISPMALAINISAGSSWGGGVCYMYVEAKSKLLLKAIEAAAVSIAPVETKSNAVLSAGRQQVIATLKATFMKENHYQPELSQLVGVFERNDGATLYCNIGESFFKLVERNINELIGKTLSFSAELIVSEKDPSKANCKRPTKLAFA